MANESLLLNFVVPTTIRDVLPSADLSWIKNVVVLCDAVGTAGVYEATSVAEVTAKTQSSCYEMLNHGVSKIILATGATAAAALVNLLADTDVSHRYYTVLVDPGLSDALTVDLSALDVVKGFSTNVVSTAKTLAAGDKTCAFYDPEDEDGILMYRAFATILSDSQWKNHQLERLDDTGIFGITDLGDANDLFDSKVSFALTDPEFKTCLALMAAGKYTITSPYLLMTVKVLTQSLFAQYLSLRNPSFTIREAGLIESYLNNNLDQALIQNGQIEELKITVDLDETLEDWFVQGTLEVRRPRAIWRMRLDFYQDIIGGTNG